MYDTISLSLFGTIHYESVMRNTKNPRRGAGPKTRFRDRGKGWGNYGACQGQPKSCGFMVKRVLVHAASGSHGALRWGSLVATAHTIEQDQQSEEQQHY